MSHYVSRMSVNSWTKRLIMAVMLLLSPLMCSAALKSNTPEEICGVLKDNQLRAGGWDTIQDDIEGCSSTRRPLSSNSTGSARITFAAKGTAGAATQVSLVITAIADQDKDAASRELIRAAKRLSVRVLGVSMPQSMVGAITKGMPMHLPAGTGTIVLMTNMAGDKLYEMTLVME